MKNIFFISIIAFFVLSACRQQISVKSKVAGNFVVFSELKVGETPEIYLTEEATYYQYLEKDGGITFIKNANVSIEGNGQTDVLELTSKQDTFYGGWSGPVYMTIYYYKGHYPLVAEKSYSLKASRDNKKISAETTLPKAVSLKSVKRNEVTQNGQTYTEYLAIFDDPKQSKDYYFVNACLGLPLYDTLGNPTGLSFWDCHNNNQYLSAFSDQSFVNNEGSVHFAYSPNSATDSLTYKITILRYNEDWGNYINSVQEQGGTGGNPLVEPTLLKSNIKGDGIGMFGGYIASPEYIIKVK